MNDSNTLNNSETAASGAAETSNDSFGMYDHQVHRVGRITTFLALITMFLPVFGVALYYKVPINWGQVAIATGMILTAFGLNGIVEPFTFAPILGAGATYIAFTTGNVSQTKVPCVVNSQDIMGVKMGTKEGDVVSTLAVGVCSLVTTLEVALGMIFVNIIYPFLTSPIMKPGFNNIMPALFGAMAAMRLIANPKVAPLPYSLYAIVLLAAGVSFNSKYGVWAMLVLIVITVSWAYFLFKKGILKEK
jgi:hypothetical protein